MNKPDLKKILIMPAAGIGDFLMAAPAIKALRENYKTAYIAVLAHHSRGAAQIGKCLPFIDEVIDFPLKKYSWGRVICFFLSSFWPMFFGLRKEKFDACFILNSNPIRTIITKLLGVKTFEAKKQGHPTQMALNLLSSLGIKTDNMDFGLVAPDIDISKYIPVDAPKPWIGLHPFSAMRWRNWENYADFINTLPDNATVIILGKDSEHKTPTGKKNVIDLVNKLSITELVAVISKLNLLVSVDSGPMHIGFAVQIPTVGIFNTVSPENRMPLTSKVSHLAIWDNKFGEEETIVKERTTKERRPGLVDTERLAAAVKECMQKNSISFFK
ncbi:MAG: glycosyltransferase family 9 protein [Phycisphaerae bacterium]|nr:glycosyltransferase family 9 protein [Phycisphaerae bacterium]